MFDQLQDGSTLTHVFQPLLGCLICFLNNFRLLNFWLKAVCSFLLLPGYWLIAIVKSPAMNFSLSMSFAKVVEDHVVEDVRRHFYVMPVVSPCPPGCPPPNMPPPPPQ